MRISSKLVVIGCIIAISAFVSACSGKKPRPAEDTTAKVEGKKECPAAREFITTLEYMKGHEEFAYSSDDAQKLALNVSKGCEGAAQRFVRVTNLLMKAGFASRDAAATGLKFASKTDRETNTFMTVFRSAFLEDYLDLDLGTSLKIAESLTTEFDGDTDVVRDDFESFVKFCVSADSLDLPRAKCAQVSANLAKRSENLGKSVYRPFLGLYDFLRSSKGPMLGVGEALNVGEEVIGSGPTAADSFMQAYRYAVSDKGLGYGSKQALDFARKMAVASAPSSSKAQR